MFVMVLWVVLFCCYLGCSRMWCLTYIYIYIYIRLGDGSDDFS